MGQMMHASARTITQAMDLMHVYPGIPWYPRKTDAKPVKNLQKYSMFHHISTPKPYAWYPRNIPQSHWEEPRKTTREPGSTRFSMTQPCSASLQGIHSITR